MSEAWREHATFRLDELATACAREFFVGSGDWPFRGILVRRGDELFAYANVCPHKNHPLNLADDDFLVKVGEGQHLRCTSHGALFVPETGLCVFGPCSGRELRRLECRVVDGVVLVRAPDSQLV